MGLGKWILKNGFGSPGSTAKTYAKQYNLIPKSDHDTEWKEVFSLLFTQSVKTANAMGNIGGNLYSSVVKEDIINFSEGDLTLFVFEMMFLATSQFRNSIVSNRDTFLLATEVMREVIVDTAPTAIKLKLNDFREKAFQFVYIYK